MVSKTAEKRNARLPDYSVRFKERLGRVAVFVRFHVSAAAVQILTSRPAATCLNASLLHPMSPGVCKTRIALAALHLADRCRSSILALRLRLSLSQDIA